MKREYGDTELIPAEDGSWQVGNLAERFYFLEDRVLYLLPGGTITLNSAAPCASLSLPDGNYLEEETGMRFSLTQSDDGWQISLPRYGTAVLYARKEEKTADCSAEDLIFSFGPDFTMYAKPEADTLVLDGYRVKHLVCRKL